jgi:dCMP deaminase
MTDWPGRFLSLAAHVATWSKDPSTKTGAVIARPDHTIVSLGFNGFPRGMADDPWRYDQREEKYSRIIHAEINALMFAREPVKGYTLYVWPFACCERCFVQLAQAGISHFVAPTCPEHLRARWESSFAKTRAYARELGVDFEEVAL